MNWYPRYTGDYECPIAKQPEDTNRNPCVGCGKFDRCIAIGVKC